MSEIEEENLLRFWLPKLKLISSVILGIPTMWLLIPWFPLIIEFKTIIKSIIIIRGSRRCQKKGLLMYICTCIYIYMYNVQCTIYMDLAIRTKTNFINFFKTLQPWFKRFIGLLQSFADHFNMIPPFNYHLCRLISQIIMQWIIYCAWT